MRTGTLEDQRGVRHVRARRVEMDVAPETEFNLDGEVCALRPVVFEVQPGGVEVVVPR
jgi:diacylglycerol kinase family enzyme